MLQFVLFQKAHDLFLKAVLTGFTNDISIERRHS